jgi:SAM-dependent methyltransferase
MGNEDVAWSDEMARLLQDSTNNHFIDIYNRDIVIDALKETLRHPGARFLDMGCSSGYMLDDIRSKYPGTELWGADFYEEGLRQCSARMPEVNLKQIDILNNQLPSDFFDAVSCLNVLEHINDHARAVSQLFRVLKRGGRAVITVPAMPRLFDLYDEVHFHVRRYKLGDLEGIVRSAGFKVIKSNYFGTLVYPGFYIVKRMNKFRYSDLPGEEKKRLVLREIEASKRSRLLEALSGIEYNLGKAVKFPFGIRAYVIAGK